MPAIPNNVNFSEFVGRPENIWRCIICVARVSSIYEVTPVVGRNKATEFRVVHYFNAKILLILDISSA